jgi:hypothetical protein
MTPLLDCDGHKMVWIPLSSADARTEPDNDSLYISSKRVMFPLMDSTHVRTSYSNKENMWKTSIGKQQSGQKPFLKGQACPSLYTRVRPILGQGNCQSVAPIRPFVAAGCDQSQDVLCKHNGGFVPLIVPWLYSIKFYMWYMTFGIYTYNASCIM